ncbi:FRIGIDA-like protein 3 [Tanacetum coccineum]
MEENARLDLSVCEGYEVRMHYDNIKVSNGDEASCNKKQRGFGKVNLSELLKSIEEYEKTLEARKRSIGSYYEKAIDAKDAKMGKISEHKDYDTQRAYGTKDYNSEQWMHHRTIVRIRSLKCSMSRNKVVLLDLVSRWSRNTVPRFSILKSVMEDAQSVATLLESTTPKIQQLQRAFAELESHRAVTLNLKWKQIEEHFNGLEKSLKSRFTELEIQEKEFKRKTTKSQQMLKKRQAAVMAKEEASLRRLQENRDAAVVAIPNVLGKRKSRQMEEQGSSPIVEEKPSDYKASKCKIEDMRKLSDIDAKALTNPQLAKLCEENNAHGLHKFISDNRKNLASMKKDISIALKAAAHPGCLVLDSLSGFYISDDSNIDGEKDANLLGQRRTCIMLMECLSILLTNLDEKSVSMVVSKEVALLLLPAACHCQTETCPKKEKKKKALAQVMINVQVRVVSKELFIGFHIHVVKLIDTVKDMTAMFGKLDKFEGNNFRRWQKKMHFLLTTLKVVYVLSTPMPEFVEDEPLEQTRRRCKWENDDYICRGHILNEDASSKKFLVSNFNNYKMVDSSIIDKLPPSWKDFKHSLKHNKEELSLVQLGGPFRIEESLRVEESGKGKGKEIVGSSSVIMIEDGKNKNNNKNNKGKKKKNDAMQSRDVAFWKEEINDEMDSIIENNTWILSDVPLGCKPLGFKWIFKRKMKVDGTIDKFKARLVIQGFRQKEGVDYFDTYAPVARISTIRLLIALVATYNLVIHQMDVKKTFLNGDLEKEVYMKHPKGFIMHDQDQVDKTKEFLSSNFSIKDMGEADVILGIRIKREDNVSTLLDSTIKLMPNTGRFVNQLEYSRAIVLEGYSDACWITNSEDHTSTTSWVFLLGGASKEAGWLRNMIYEIPLWPKPISPISIHCDSAITLAKAYCQIYNGKSRHLAHDGLGGAECTLVRVSLISPGQRHEGQGAAPLARSRGRANQQHRDSAQVLVCNGRELQAWYAESINVGHADLCHIVLWPTLASKDDLT